MKNFFAIVIALLMLTTNVGITFASHYCQGELVQGHISIGQTEVNCGDFSQESQCRSDERKGLHKKSCCENQYLQISIENDFNSVKDFKYSEQGNSFLTCNSTESKIICSEFSLRNYQSYKPPIPNRLIYLWHETFLI
ncbi:hypothetical protein GYB22_06455 [bacterium]|nr:hypothetical protein [bacterium]